MVIVSPTGASPTAFSPVAIYPTWPAESESTRVGLGLKQPISSMSLSAPDDITLRRLLRPTEPSATRT